MMQKSILAKAVSDVIEGNEPSLINGYDNTSTSDIDVDNILENVLVGDNPQKWEDLNELFSVIGGELCSLTVAAHQMVTNKDVLKGLNDKEPLFLESAQRFFKDIEITSSKLAELHKLHKDKLGVISNGDEFADFNDIFFKYKNISDQGLAIVSTTLVDITLMASEAHDLYQTSNTTESITDGEFKEVTP